MSELGRQTLKNVRVTRHAYSMLETLFLACLIYLFITRSKKSKKNMRPRTLDGELKELIARSNENTGIALEIKRYLLSIAISNENHEEKFSDAHIAKAQEILDHAGPSAFYWMSDIAAQLAQLAASQINGVATNVNIELGESATAKDIIRVVVRP